MREKKAAVLTNRVFDWLTGKPSIGGGERYTLDLANLLSENGYSVDIYQASLRSRKSVDIAPNIRLIFLRPEIEHGWPEKWMCEEFYRRTPSYDIHITTLPEYMGGPVHKGTILTVQGNMWSNKKLEEFSDLDKKRIVSYMDKADQVVTIHKYIQSDIIAIGFDGDIEIIRHGIDTDIFHPGTDERRKFVLFPGRAEKIKGTDFYRSIIDSFVFLKNGSDWSYGWVGSGSDQDNLPYRNSFSLDEMPPVYGRASIACVLNMWEKGTSLALLEAMASGCACIAFESAQDAIVDGVNGLTAKKTVDSLNEKIEILMDDAELRCKLGDKARITIEEHYSKAGWQERWKSVLGI